MKENSFVCFVFFFSYYPTLSPFYLLCLFYRGFQKKRGKKKKKKEKRKEKKSKGWS